MAELTQSRVRELFNYDEGTGALIWRPRPREEFRSESHWARFNAHIAGKEAGTVQQTNSGVSYKRVFFGRKSYANHKVIWLYVHGHWPEHDIDHKNRCRIDNRLENLRIATKSQNSANRVFKNRVGLKGAYRQKGRDTYYSMIRVERKAIYLGFFYSEIEAHEAYKAAAQKYFGEFANW